MGIGASLALIVIGAILTFALNVRVGFVDLDVVGWIMMAAGALGLIFTAWIWGNRRRQVVTDGPGYRRVEEREDYGPTDPV